ncbi:shikimate kinase [Chitinophagaceae bacterium MMS25-I14]
MSRFIFLIGMPGAGKTYWGTRVATAMDIRFKDLDNMVEEREGVKILALFARHGEERFRELERDALLEVVTEEREDVTLVSCGGGTPCFFDNIDIMKDAGCVIYLRATIDTLLNRLFSDLEFRPLLQADSVLESLAHLLMHRASFYEQADYIVDVEMLSLDTFEEIIHSCTSAHL